MHQQQNSFIGSPSSSVTSFSITIKLAAEFRYAMPPLFILHVSPVSSFGDALLCFTMYIYFILNMLLIIK